jgi:hypothetical protein
MAKQIFDISDNLKRMAEDKLGFGAPGNYNTLIVYRKAETIYDMTCFFVDNFLQSDPATANKMRQAARDGKQTIVEASTMAGVAPDKEIELKIAAKAFLLTLLEDYRDFLRTRGLRQWEDGSVEVSKMRELGREHNDSAFFMGLVKTRPVYTIANMVICIIKQNDYLMYELIKSMRNLEKARQERLAKRNPMIKFKESE